MTLPEKIEPPANLTELANKLAEMLKEPEGLFARAKERAIAKGASENDSRAAYAEPGADQAYERAAEVLVEAAVMAFELAARDMGVSGFQAGWATQQIYRRLSGTEGPYKILKAEDALFPQYDGRVAEFYRDQDVKDYLVGRALENLAEWSVRGHGAAPSVEARHVQIATDYDHWNPRP